MATKHDVIRLHRGNPDWTSVDIAAALGCLPAYVRATAKRNGLSLPCSRVPNGTSIQALGRECRDLGLTINDLRRIAAVVEGIRPEVLAFAHLMERELRNNDHKTGWKDASPVWLAGRTFDEAQELCDIANDYEAERQSPIASDVRDEVAGEAADVANMAMMVADVCGCLDDIRVVVAKHGGTK